MGGFSRACYDEKVARIGGHHPFAIEDMLNTDAEIYRDALDFWVRRNIAARLMIILYLW